MNSLSWFIYMADVLPRLTILSFISGVVLFIVAAIIPKKGVEIFGYEHTGPFHGVDRLKGFIIAWIILLLASVLAPSKDTIYLIAASEAGEAVVTSPEAKEVMNDLKEILSIQLNKLKQ